MMAMLSKVVSPRLAKGTFNSGLLSTEAGTIGRVVGDMFITVTSSLRTLNIYEPSIVESLVNCLYGPIAVGLVVSILLVSSYKHILGSD